MIELSTNRPTTADSSASTATDPSRKSTPSITIDRLAADGTVLECTVRPSRRLKRFFTGEPLVVDYGVDIEDVPRGILAIAPLAQLCPVAWARGADVYVEAVDPVFARALEDVGETLCGMYDFLEGGDLYVRREGEESTADAPNRRDSGASGLLFTGGVDSTSSYVAHRDEAPTLISIRGWTIRPDPDDDEKWAALTDRVSEFAAERGLETAFVEANMLSFLDNPMLLSHYGHRVDGGWYSSVGHGLGLLGLCAPLAYARGIEDLYVAATHWEGVDLEWGSRPDVDDRVHWSGTRCHHDGYERTRQERLDLIAEYVREEAPNLELQTCNVRMDGNCGRCEKCYRTAVGLRLAGLEPSDHGYSLTDDEYIALRQSLEGGEWILGEDERYMWEDIRNHVNRIEPRSPAERAFVDWLRTADLADLVDEAEPPLSHRLLRTGARNVPASVYNVLYPAWCAAKTGYRRVGTGL